MIRKATIEDAARIAEIEIVSSRFAYNDIVLEKILYKDYLIEDRIQRFKDWISKEIFSIYVYEDDINGVIKGMMGFGKCGDEDKTEAFELHFIYIEPAFSRKGIGRKMLDFFEKEGSKGDYKEFVIWVLQENEIGKSFYQKNNYNSDGTEKIFQRYGKKEIRFIKDV